MYYKQIVLLLTLSLCCATARAQKSRQPGHTRPRAKPSRPAGKVIRLLPPSVSLPLVTRTYLDLFLRLKQGRVQTIKVVKGHFPKGPKLIPRFTGRFRVLLYTHGLLRDRLAFNFPLTAGAGEPTALNRNLDRSLARGVSARMRVRVPWDSRITRLEVLDRATKRVVQVSLKRLLPAALPLKTKNLRTVTFGRPRASPKKKAVQQKKKGRNK